MGEREWNRGLDDAAEGCPPRSQHPDYIEGYRYGEYDDKPQQEPQQPEPSDEELCASQGHPYHGDDERGGRCYCGERRYTCPLWLRHRLQEAKEYVARWLNGR